MHMDGGTQSWVTQVVVRTWAYMASNERKVHFFQEVTRQRKMALSFQGQRIVGKQILCGN